MSEKTRQSSETVSKKPSARVDLRNTLDQTMRIDAKKLLETEAFRQKLSGENLEKFMKDHSADAYTDYKKWNKDFLEQVMGLKDLTPVQERVHILALQELLNKEKGGFTDKQGRVDSFDAKLGPYTLSKMAEYLNKKAETAKSATPQSGQQPAEKRTPDTADNKDADVLSRLGEKERFEPKNVFYAGDSIMVEIARKVTANNRRALKSSHLSKTRGFDTEKYRRTHIFVEEEALKFLDDPKCKMLVVNGGGNDLATRGGNNEKRLDEVADQIIESFRRIIEKAHSKGIKVSIYKLYRSADSGISGKARDKVNQWLVEKSGADVLLDTTMIVKGRMAKDGIHPTSVACGDLYSAVTKTVQTIYT